MSLQTNVHSVEGIEYIDMFLPVNVGTQWMARAVWPCDYHMRAAVIAEMLRTIGTAVLEGKIQVEDFHVPTT